MAPPPRVEGDGRIVFPSDPPPGYRLQVLGEPGRRTIAMPSEGKQKLAFHARLSAVVFSLFAIFAWTAVAARLVDPDRPWGELATAGFLAVGFSLGAWAMVTVALSAGPARYGGFLLFRSAAVPRQLLVPPLRLLVRFGLS